jgi:integrase
MSAPIRTKVEPGIWQRGDTLEITFRDAQGKQRRKTVPGGIMAARKALNAEVAKRDRGERVAADPRLRFDAAADAWHEARVLRLRRNSQATYGFHLKHLREHFGRWRMTDIGPADVAKYVTAKENAGLAGKTIGAHLNVLSAVFDYATRHLGLASTNPVTSLDRVERPSGARKRDLYVMTPSELTRSWRRWRTATG